MTTRAERRARLLAGDQGLPICSTCKAEYRHRPDGDGRTVEICRCGERYLPTIGRRPAPAPAPAVHLTRPHGQSDQHPWKRAGKFANPPNEGAHHGRPTD